MKVMDAAFRLGYRRFRDAARFVLDQIRAAIGDDVANAITLDHLQGSYIGMAGKYRDQGAERAAVVATVESLDEITAPAPQESNDVPSTDGNLETENWMAWCFSRFRFMTHMNEPPKPTPTPSRASGCLTVRLPGTSEAMQFILMSPESYEAMKSSAIWPNPSEPESSGLDLVKF